MDGLARSARRAALVSVAAASVLFACVLVWNLMPGGTMGNVATWTLAAVLALVLLPIASLVAWEVDRRAAARAAKQDLDRALRDWARLTECEPKTSIFGMDSVSAIGADSATHSVHADPTPSKVWSRSDEPAWPSALDAKGATMSAAPTPRVEAPEHKGDSPVSVKPAAADSRADSRTETRSDSRSDASRVREPVPTPRRVTHPHRRAVRNR
jgi:hypothetical protein